MAKFVASLFSLTDDGCDGALVSRRDSLLKCLLQLSLATRRGGRHRADNEIMRLIGLKKFRGPLGQIVPVHISSLK